MPTASSTKQKGTNTVGPVGYKCPAISVGEEKGGTWVSVMGNPALFKDVLFVGVAGEKALKKHWQPDAVFKLHRGAKAYKKMEVVLKAMLLNTKHAYKDRIFSSRLD